MCLKNRILTVLKSKSGASILFVLGIMLFLLAVGSSVMAAASANHGSNARQNRYNAALVLNESIQRNIRYSLQSTDENTLASNLTRALYDNRNTPLSMFELNLTGVTGLITTGDSRNATVTLNFPEQNVHSISAVPAMPELDEPRRPTTAIVNSVLIVEVEVVIDASRVLTTRATYELSNGLLTDEGTYEPDVTDDVVGPLELIDQGQWKLVNYEISE